MWVYRSVLYINPGRMAEAIANLKETALPASVHRRLLRPLNGAEAANQLVDEFEFEDLDAAAADYGHPGLQSEASKRFVELNQNRGARELYRVVHDVPCQGAPGLWVDRRERWVPSPRMSEALELWRTFPRLTAKGWSLRIMTARTGSEAPALLVVETTCDSLAEGDAAIGKFGSTPEGAAFVAKLRELELREADKYLLRVVD
jgi:hypothetical protein